MISNENVFFPRDNDADGSPESKSHERGFKWIRGSVCPDLTSLHSLRIQQQGEDQVGIGCSEWTDEEISITNFMDPKKKISSARPFTSFIFHLIGYLVILLIW